MKTNVTMRSTDRKLFGMTVRQETQTGFLNLSDLQGAYEIARGIHGWSDKQYQDILSLKTNTERIYYILESQGLINTGFSVFIEQVENEGILKVLKSIGAYKTTGRGTNKTVSCNPYIWVLIAMELNPMLYAKVMTWLTDSLILNRIEAGDFYKDFSRAIKPLGPDYVKVAKALNYVVFNRHESGIRNTATKEQLSELVDLEKKMAFAIDMGYIKSQNQLINSLRDIWNKKWQKICLSY
jgi:hypothetical protein